MLLIKRPAIDTIEKFRASQAKESYSYSELEMSRKGHHQNYHLDHNRINLGEGEGCYQAAISAVQRWEMFQLGWVELYATTTPIEPGRTIAVLINHYLFYSLNACRIVYTIDERDSEIFRYGFAYGTLTEHGEIGEERFSVEWHKTDNSVWYDIVALSKPGLLAMMGYPVTRYFQKRFARDSKQAMVRAVSNKQ